MIQPLRRELVQVQPQCKSLFSLFCVYNTIFVSCGAYVFWQRKQKCLDFFKVQIEPKDLQKRQAPLWIREKKTRMMRTLLNLCKKLFKKFIWAKTGQRIFEAKTTAFTTSSGACAVLRYRSNPLQEKGTASELFLSCQPSSKRSDFKITLFTQFSTDFHAQ